MFKTITAFKIKVIATNFMHFKLNTVNSDTIFRNILFEFWKMYRLANRYSTIIKF